MSYMCERRQFGGETGKRGRRVNLKQPNTRGKVIVVSYSFHFCRWSVWSSMIENLSHVLGALYFNMSFY